MNVLESLKLVSRVAKNQYLWHGRQRLRETLSELRGSGWRQCCPLQEEDCQRMQTGEAAVQEGYVEAGFGKRKWPAFGPEGWCVCVCVLTCGPGIHYITLWGHSTM